MAASPSVINNPFRDAVLGDPWTDPVANVAQIGLEAFTLYRREFDAVRQMGVSRSILFFGASGSGKTHLIGRIRRHLEERAKTGWLTGLFVALRMQTAPSRIWRHLRRRFVEDLLRRPAEGPSQLDRLIFRKLAEPASRGKHIDQWKAAVLENSLPLSQDGLSKGLYTIVRQLEKTGGLQQLEGDLFEVLEGDEKLSFELKRVLQHFIIRRNIALVHGWLRGDSLAEADLATLGLKPGEDDDNPEGASRDLVLSLLRLVGRGTPVVFCFDQLEALRLQPGDTAGFYAFGSMASALHDETENSLLISCIMSQFVTELQGVTGSNYARMAGVQRTLPGVTYEQAERLIKSRLDLVPSSFKTAIDMDEVKALFADKTEVTARKVLAYSAQLFDQQPAIPVERFLSNRWDDHLQQAESDDKGNAADQILEYGIPVLLRLDGSGSKVAAGAGDVNFTVTNRGEPTAISICNQKNMTALARQLRRLQTSPQQRLVLIRDGRLPIPKTARKTWEYLGQLTSSGTRLLRPSVEAISALDALRTLLSEAQAGDLSLNGEAVAATTVEEWLSIHLPSALRDFSRDLTTIDTPEADVGLREALVELLAALYVVPMADAAKKLGCDEQDLEAIAVANPGAIGLLEGPPALLFHPVSGGGN